MCPDCAADAELRDLLDRLRALVAASSPPTRTRMLHKLYWEAIAQVQVAEEQGVSQQTVSRRVAEILAELKEAIEPAATRPPPPRTKAKNPQQKSRNFGQIVSNDRPSRLYVIEGEGSTLLLATSSRRNRFSSRQDDVRVAQESLTDNASNTKYDPHVDTGIAVRSIGSRKS